MEDLLLIVLRLDQERHAPTAHCDELLFILRVGQNLTELGLGHVGNLASLLHAHLNDQRQTVLTLKGLCTHKRENSPTTMSIGLQFTVNSEERIDWG